MKRLIVLAAGILAALAVTAVPATAGHGAENSGVCNGWEAAGAGVFDSLGALATADSSARTAGAVTKEPSLNAVYEPLPTSANGKGGPKFRANVSVWMHVISDGQVGNVPQSVIDKQMSVLNLSFAAFYGGAKSGFSFTLAGVTRTDNAEWYNARAGSNPERDMKKTLHRGGFETLNVYTNLAGGYLGYAYLPGLPDSHLWQDGVVLNWESMPEASPTFAGLYDLGFTLVHEAGHWFNLEHTFYGGCNAKGDFVADTPPMRVPTRGCPEGKDTCLEPGLDSIHNYMDYSDDPCYTEFTAGQVARAQDAWLYHRAG
ncbi:MAG: zinc metalloprotease [Actinomycetota bacterium]|nr:zinc metalloprotease [Actinomycetota bacterium]